MGVFEKIIICVSCLLILTASVSVAVDDLIKKAGINVYTDDNFVSKTGIKVKDSNFQDGKLVDHRISKIKGESDMIILFYSAKCPHCQKYIKEVYQYLGKKIEKMNFKVSMGAVECNLNPQTCKVMNVQGYPEIIYFKKEGELYMYPRKIERTIGSNILFMEYGHEGKQLNSDEKTNDMTIEDYIKKMETKLGSSYKAARTELKSDKETQDEDQSDGPSAGETLVKDTEPQKEESDSADDDETEQQSENQQTKKNKKKKGGLRTSQSKSKTKKSSKKSDDGQEEKQSGSGILGFIFNLLMAGVFIGLLYLFVKKGILEKQQSFLVRNEQQSSLIQTKESIASNNSTIEPQRAKTHQQDKPATLQPDLFEEEQ